jgi:hypothetical protein
MFLIMLHDEYKNMQLRTKQEAQLKSSDSHSGRTGRMQFQSITPEIVAEKFNQLKLNNRVALLELSDQCQRWMFQKPADVKGWITKSEMNLIQQNVMFRDDCRFSGNQQESQRSGFQKKSGIDGNRYIEDQRQKNKRNYKRTIHQ